MISKRHAEKGDNSRHSLNILQWNRGNGKIYFSFIFFLTGYRNLRPKVNKIFEGLSGTAEMCLANIMLPPLTWKSVFSLDNYPIPTVKESLWRNRVRRRNVVHWNYQRWLKNHMPVKLTQNFHPETLWALTSWTNPNQEVHSLRWQSIPATQQSTKNNYFGGVNVASLPW